MLLRFSALSTTLSTTLSTAVVSTSLAVVFPGVAVAQSDAPLHVDVSKVASGDGQICIALFASPVGFPSDSAKAFRSLCHLATDAQDGALRFSLYDLPAGRYAASVFHDENADGKMNTGLFGIPKESFGFSGNPVIRIGAPKFEACRMTHGKATTVTAVALKAF